MFDIAPVRMIDLASRSSGISVRRDDCRFLSMMLKLIFIVASGTRRSR
jgi:hypothetical protein